MSFFAYLLPLFAQQNAEEIRLVEEQFIINDDATLQTESTGASDSSQDESNGTSIVWQLVKIILSLVLVIAVIYGIVWLLKKSANPAFTPNPYLKKVATLPLASGKTVYIVATPTQAFLIGATDTNINLIGEITDKELVDLLLLKGSDEQKFKPVFFENLLSSFFSKQKTATQSFGGFDALGSSLRSSLRTTNDERGSQGAQNNVQNGAFTSSLEQDALDASALIRKRREQFEQQPKDDEL